MPSQVYNIIPVEETIKIEKNGIEILYNILLNNKSINLKELYDNMCVDINDEYCFVEGLKKTDEPKSDSDRVFNNTYDFISLLIFELNKKLKELRERQDTSIFK